jgi:hypothetical protein
MEKRNLLKCSAWLVGALVCLLVLALGNVGTGIYYVAAVLGAECMIGAIVDWERVAMPRTGDIFKFN